MRSLGVLALLMILGATSAGSDCESTAGNLLAGSNCGFNQNANGWTASSGAAMSQDPADHGVLKAVADSQGSLTILGPCVAAQPMVTYRLGARLRAIAGTPYFCSMNVFQYSDAHCTEGAAPLGSAAAPPNAKMGDARRFCNDLRGGKVASGTAGMQRQTWLHCGVRRLCRQQE